MGKNLVSDNQLSLPLATNTQQERHNSRTIAQHNDLVRAHYDFTLTEHRLFIAMLARINKGDIEFHLNRIPISELFPEQGNANRSGSRFPQVRRAIDRLTDQKIKVLNISEKGGREYISIPLMAIGHYKEGTGYVDVKFNDYAKKYLLDLKNNFTTAHELTLLSFHSSYSHRLYWFLKSELYNKNTFEIEVIYLRQMLSLENSYPAFKDFRRNVIDIAQRELESTDMAFDYTIEKVARIPKSIIFTRKAKFQSAIADIDFPESIQVKLTEIGISLKSLKEIKVLYAQKKIDEGYINFVINYYQEVNKTGKLRSPAGAIFKALTTDQLRPEFATFQQQSAPIVYKKPQPASKPQAGNKAISFEELENGWNVLSRKGLTKYATFNDSLADYANNPMYRFEERDGKQYLIVTE
jgi:plasmid replication initiation protein